MQVLLVPAKSLLNIQADYGFLQCSPGPKPQIDTPGGPVLPKIGEVGATNLPYLCQKYLTTTVLSQVNVVQPDFLFLSTTRSSIITERNIQDAPDLVGEILSNHTRENDEGIKPTRYERAQVQNYWIIDPNSKQDNIIQIRKGRGRSYPRTLVIPYFTDTSEMPHARLGGVSNHGEGTAKSLSRNRSS